MLVFVSLNVSVFEILSHLVDTTKTQIRGTEEKMTLRHIKHFTILTADASNEFDGTFSG